MIGKIVSLSTVSVLGSLWLYGYGPLQAQNPILAQREISRGWYERADSRAFGSGITSWNMRLGETGVRCMCAGGPAGADDRSGFWVHDDGDTFVVVRAPDGYFDTIGRRFKQKQPRCLNCAD